MLLILFEFEQVGTNCGLIGQNACCEIDGVAYWLSNNGFFSFDGTVNSLPCVVEDYVFDDFATTKGQQVYAGINNLFTEVIWYYPSSSASYNDRYVVFNYGESGRQAGGFGIQESILILLELLLLMQQFIQNLMLLNLIVRQLVLFQM